MAIKDYSTEPDMNTTISGINIAEGCAPSGINNAIRQLMADVKAEKDARDAELSASASAQSTKDAGQDKAIAEAQSAANNAQSTADTALAKETVLPGTVIAWAANSDPNGYLLCNGAAVSRATYEALFSAIGTTYGSGDGSSTFNLPNLKDKFIQGSGTAGTEMAAGLPNIVASSELSRAVGTGGYTSVTNPTGAFYAANSRTATLLGSSDTKKAVADLGFDASLSHTIYGASTTVQPPAVTMRYYIKY